MIVTRSTGLTSREASAALDLSVGGFHAYIKRDSLKASLVSGMFGDEYRIRPAVLAAWAAEHLSLELDVEALSGATIPTSETPDMSADMRELYERLLAAGEEATRCKVLAEVSESTKAEAEEQHQAMLSELRQERDEARTKAEETGAELVELKSRGFWARVFGGAG